MNLAGVLPWTFVRAFGVIALLVVGNIFCLSCPFMLPRELGHRLGLAPLEVAALAARQVAGDRTDGPVLLVLRGLCYLGPSRAHRVASDRLLRRCLPRRYIVSRGKLLQIRLSAGAIQFCRVVAFALHPGGEQPGSLRALHHPRLHRREPATARLRTAALYAAKGRKHGLHALHGLRQGLPPRQHRPLRRSPGARYAARPGAIVDREVLVAHRHRGARPGGRARAFVNAGWMVVPPALGRYLATGRRCGSGAAVLLLAAGPSKKELFCRFSQALLPLGLAMWAAHLLFHLFTGWGTLGPALHQAGADFGWHLVAPPQWGMAQPLLPAKPCSRYSFCCWMRGCS